MYLISNALDGGVMKDKIAKAKKCVNVVNKVRVTLLFGLIAYHNSLVKKL